MATVVPVYVASELKTPLKNILVSLSLSLRRANWPGRGHLLGPPRQALKSDLCGFGVRTGNTAPILRFQRDPGASPAPGLLSLLPPPGLHPAASEALAAPSLSSVPLRPPRRTQEASFYRTVTTSSATGGPLL